MVREAAKSARMSAITDARHSMFYVFAETMPEDFRRRATINIDANADVFLADTAISTRVFALIFARRRRRMVNAAMAPQREPCARVRGGGAAESGIARSAPRAAAAETRYAPQAMPLFARRRYRVFRFRHESNILDGRCHVVHRASAAAFQPVRCSAAFRESRATPRYRRLRHPP